jgi:hypothetical protein
MTRTAIALFSGAILFVALPVFAQFDFSDGSALTIAESPTHPGPGGPVQLTVQSPLIDLADSDIVWTVNGNPAGSGESITTTLGKLGSKTGVSVSVSGANGSDSAQITLIPTSIDLLFEADSYIPPFYQGRAAPSSGSSIRLLAIPHFVNADGSSVPPTDISFAWKVNGALLKSSSGIGESSAVIPAAILFGTDDVTVDAQSADGSFSGEASVSIRTQDPQLALYEDSPLFGVMYHRALGGTTAASESETSFAAVPYFADVSAPNDVQLAYQWRVNGISLVTDQKDPSEITIDAKSANSAQIDLSLSSPTDPFVSTDGSWAVSFASSAPSQNVFNTPAQ